MDRTARPGRRARDALEYLALFAALAVVILLVVHPWITYFASGLPDHWDPPNHTTRLCWNADRILHGRLWGPDYNCNYFYPHAYTLAFDEPLWPPSFFSAVIYGFSGDPVLVWNATALFVWALSGVTMYAFLRELPVSRGAAILGAAAFCLMPYRLEYYKELNMIVCFGIPLTYLFLIRWLRRLRWVDALLLALSFWIAAATCLYYTIIMTVPIPFIVAGFLVRRPAMLRERRFYLTAALAVGVTAVLCLVTLYPFLILRYEAQYVRTIKEQARHATQPLAYLRPSKSSLIHRFAAKANLGETVVFPGIAVCVLACLYWIRERLAVRRWRNAPTKARVRQGLGYARGALWFVFTALVVYGAYHTHTSSFASVKGLVIPAINAVFWISLALLFLPADRDTASARAALSGLAVGAVACFILSFGPTVTLGHGHDIVEVGKGAMARLYRIVPFFSLMRVTTRFSIIVLLFLIAGGCFALDMVLKKAPRLRWLWVVPLVLIVVETYSRPYKFLDHRRKLASPVQRYLQELPDKASVVQVPYGPRELDGPAMMLVVGRFNYAINGLAGFMPKEHRRLGEYLSSDRMEEAAEWLREIWPDVYLVVDLGGVEWYRRHQPDYPFTESDLELHWEKVMPEDMYALYRLRPLEETPARIVRRLRTDVLRRHPCLRFEAHALDIPDGAAAQLRVQVNDHEVETLPITDEFEAFEVRIPRSSTGNIYGEEVTLSLEFIFPDHTEQTDAPGLWELRNLDFATK